MAANRVQKSSIILNRPNDWDEWIGLVRNKAISTDVWEYVDPDVNVDRLPVLTKPQLLSVANFRAERALLTVPAQATENTPATLIKTIPLTKDKAKDPRMRRKISPHTSENERQFDPL